MPDKPALAAPSNKAVYGQQRHVASVTFLTSPVGLDPPS